MKNLISLSVLFSLLFLFTAFSQNKIPASEAKNHNEKMLFRYGFKPWKFLFYLGQAFQLLLT
jgi:hypothetical protein